MNVKTQIDTQLRIKGNHMCCDRAFPMKTSSNFQPPLSREKSSKLREPIFASNLSKAEQIKVFHSFELFFHLLFNFSIIRKRKRGHNDLDKIQINLHEGYEADKEFLSFYIHTMSGIT